ncbi:unnamed protein product [Protopolystoma xenopodis]|uniref:Uncharacterized protein n=1 Tax=Protopolystoma xenopodis TaxID=117903 RepID=A0A3S5BKW4_9PLAT|nr:unnamed protein product [Protopolystoma xenopodis]
MLSTVFILLPAEKKATAELWKIICRIIEQDISDFGESSLSTDQLLLILRQLYECLNTGRPETNKSMSSKSSGILSRFCFPLTQSPNSRAHSFPNGWPAPLFHLMTSSWTFSQTPSTKNPSRPASTLHVGAIARELPSPSDLLTTCEYALSALGLLAGQAAMKLGRNVLEEQLNWSSAANSILDVVLPVFSPWLMARFPPGGFAGIKSQFISASTSSNRVSSPRTVYSPVSRFFTSFRRGLTSRRHYRSSSPKACAKITTPYINYKRRERPFKQPLNLVVLHAVFDQVSSVLAAAIEASSPSKSGDHRFASNLLDAFIRWIVNSAKNLPTTETASETQQISLPGLLFASEDVYLPPNQLSTLWNYWLPTHTCLWDICESLSICSDDSLSKAATAAFLVRPLAKVNWTSSELLSAYCGLSESLLLKVDGDATRSALSGQLLLTTLVNLGCALAAEDDLPGLAEAKVI